MTQRKKQNKVLYMCLIMLIVTASVLVAVSSGAGRRAVSEQSTKQTESKDAVKKQPQTENNGGVRPDETAKPENESNKIADTDAVSEDAAAPDDKAEPVSLSVDDIEFVPPSDGYVIVPCSITVPMYSITMNDYRCHTGIDIAASLGEPVLACADGEISNVYDDPMMGKTVVITHADGVESIYKNLAEELPESVSLGAAVSAGDTIGCVGESALIECEEEPHFHFELKVNGEHADPTEYIAVSSIDSVFED